MWSRLPLSRISFRSQITLLGITAAVLLLALLCATFAALQYTKSAVLSGDQRHLAETTRSLAREYNDKVEVARLNHEPGLLEGPRTDAVSYTHLDVYKRQLSTCPFALFTPARG